jgi:hypothetical protein
MNFTDPTGKAGIPGVCSSQTLPSGFKYYGNWGGPGWTGGQTKPLETLTPQEEENLAPPVDDQDYCYRLHDYCYSDARKNNMGGRKPGKPGEDPPGPDAICDFKLAQCLHNIPWTQFNGHEFCGDVLWPSRAIGLPWIDWLRH